jgi:hypothetical protein
MWSIYARVGRATKRKIKAHEETIYDKLLSFSSLSNIRAPHQTPRHTLLLNLGQNFRILEQKVLLYPTTKSSISKTPKERD